MVTGLAQGDHLGYYAMHIAPLAQLLVALSGQVDLS